MKRSAIIGLVAISMWPILGGHAHAQVLFVSNNSQNNVLRYNATTGVFIGQFVPGTNGTPGAGGLVSPLGLAIGPNNSLLVAGGGTGRIHSYDIVTGQPLGDFADLGANSIPRDLVIGPSGDLFVSDSFNSRVMRFNGVTGTSMGVFASGPELSGPEGMNFGPDGNLYVASTGTRTVNRYNGTTGALLGVFVTSAAGANTRPLGLQFGADGSLYVGSDNGGFPGGGVKRDSGNTGASLGVFATAPDLVTPFGVEFGPDGNLYVSKFDGDGRVKRFDATTGQFIDDFVTSGPAFSPSWLVGPTYMLFSPVPEPSAFLLGGVALQSSSRKHADYAIGECLASKFVVSTASRSAGSHPAASANTLSIFLGR